MGGVMIILEIFICYEGADVSKILLKGVNKRNIKNKF